MPTCRSATRRGPSRPGLSCRKAGKAPVFTPQFGAISGFKQGNSAPAVGGLSPGQSFGHAGGSRAARQFREEQTMQKMTRRALGAAGLAFIVTTSAVYAQEAQPVRVRGEITKVDGNTLSVKARDGQNLTVKLADHTRIAALPTPSLPH